MLQTRYGLLFIPSHNHAGHLSGCTPVLEVLEVERSRAQPDDRTGRSPAGFTSMPGTVPLVAVARIPGPSSRVTTSSLAMPQPDPCRSPTPPTPVRTRGGTPAPSYYYDLPYFLAPLIGVVGGSSGVLRLCCEYYGCVTVCLCSDLQVKGLLSPVPGGVCPGGLLGFCSRLASLVGSTLRRCLASSSSGVRAGGCSSPTIRASSLRVPV